MSEPFKLVPGVYPPPSEPDPDEVLRGDWWSVLFQDGQYILDYISGELAGRVKQLVISKEEYERIKSGATSVESVLLAHDAG